MIPIPIPSRKTIIWICIVVAVGILLLLGINYLNTFQKITVTYDTSLVSKLELLPAANTRNVLTPTGDSVQVVESGKQYFVKKGLYALKPTGEKIDESLISMKVGDQPVTKTLDIDFSKQQLATLLSTEEATIIDVVRASNSGIPLFYRVNSGQLYHHGEWYATTLSYGGPEDLRRDTLRLVAKKQDGKWSVVTNPPQVILNKLDYPNIPVAILQKANAIDLGIPYRVDLNTSTTSDQGHAD
ncbi:MAG: hypothetical protein WBP22_04020 [Candidatus Saccharimonas sp.]